MSVYDDLSPNTQEKWAIEAGEKAYKEGLPIYANPYRDKNDILSMFWSLGFLSARFPQQTHITEIISALAMMKSLPKDDSNQSQL